MSAGAVDVLAEMDAHADGIAKYVASLTHPRHAKARQDAEAGLLEFRAARAYVAELIAERDALRWALNEYPKRNSHQLQARKVCDGVTAAARVRLRGASDV